MHESRVCWPAISSWETGFSKRSINDPWLLPAINIMQLVIMTCRLGVKHCQSILVHFLLDLTVQKFYLHGQLQKRCQTQHLHLFEPLKCCLSPPPPPTAILFILLSTATLAWWKCSVRANTHIMHTQCTLTGDSTIKPAPQKTGHSWRPAKENWAKTEPWTLGRVGTKLFPL